MTGKVLNIDEHLGRKEADKKSALASEILEGDPVASAALEYIAEVMLDNGFGFSTTPRGDIILEPEWWDRIIELAKDDEKLTIAMHVVKESAASCYGDTT